MALIKYYLDPAADAEIDEYPTVGESLLSRWPDKNPPRGLKIYRERVAEPNDVTMDVKLLTTATDDTFIVVVEAAELSTTALVIISLVVSVASIFLAPTVSVAAPPNANRNQQSPNNFFGARRNEPRVNQRSADIRGTVRNAYPDLIQVPYRKFRGGVEYEYIYAQVSEGYIATQADNWRDGATQINRIDGARLAVYGPDTSPLSGTPELVIGSAPEELVYTVAQSNEVSGDVLTPPNKSNPTTAEFTIYADGTVEQTGGDPIDFTTIMQVGGDVQIIDFNIFESNSPDPGFTRIDISGTYNVLAVTTTTFQVNNSTVPEWSGLTAPEIMVSQAYIDGLNIDVYYFTPGPNRYLVEFEPSILGQSSTSAIGPINVTGYDSAWINIVAINGLYKDDGTNITTVEINFQCVEFELDVNGNRTGNSTTTFGIIKTIGDDLKAQVGVTLDVPLIYSASEITVARTTDTDTSFAGTVVDEIQWRDLYLVNDVTIGELDVSYATTVHAEIKATPNALRVKERKLNFAGTRLVAEYLGAGLFAATESTESDLFADVIASIWRDPLFGRAEDDEVNWEQLFSMQADMLTYYGLDPDPLRVGYTFDSDKISAEDAIKLICNAVNVIPYRVGSVLNFWFESPQTVSAMQFGHRFKHPGTDRRSRLYAPEDDRTGVELTYFDEVTESFETLIRGNDINPLKIELSGCITARGAQIRIDREWNKLQYSRIQHQFDATAIGRMVAPGMRIDVIDNTRYAPLNGEIRAVDGLTLTISHPVTLTTPTDYSVVLTRSDGTIESRAITAQPAPNKVTIASAPSEAPYTGRDKDKTAYSIATDDERTALAMLVREIAPKDYNRVTVSCINYDARYYSEDNL